MVGMKLHLESSSQWLNKFRKVLTFGGPCVSQSGEFIVLLAIITSIWENNFIVTNTLYHSIVKQKVKTRASIRKGLIDMVWREKEIPAQYSNY